MKSRVFTEDNLAKWVWRQIRAANRRSAKIDAYPTVGEAARYFRISNVAVVDCVESYSKVGFVSGLWGGDIPMSNWQLEVISLVD